MKRKKLKEQTICEIYTIRESAISNYIKKSLYKKKTIKIKNQIKKRLYKEKIL